MGKILGTVMALAGVGLWLLGAGIYLLTLYFAYLTGFVPMLLTLMFPIAGQLVWLWVVWGTTGVFFNYYTLLCLTWLLLGAIVIGVVSTAERKST